MNKNTNVSRLTASYLLLALPLVIPSLSYNLCILLRLFLSYRELVLIISSLYLSRCIFLYISMRSVSHEYHFELLNQGGFIIIYRYLYVK